MEKEKKPNWRVVFATDYDVEADSYEEAVEKATELLEQGFESAMDSGVDFNDILAIFGSNALKIEDEKLV